MNHTPGPWRVGNWYRGRLAVTVGNLADYSIVAELTGAKPEHEANARLIATAPEMLEALKMVMASVPFFSYRGDGELEEVEIAVRTAIAKAEGGNNVEKAG